LGLVSSVTRTYLDLESHLKVPSASFVTGRGAEAGSRGGATAAVGPPMATPTRTRTRPSTETTSAPVPLAVWPVAQTSAQYQRVGRYHPGCAAHPSKMLPALARRIVEECSEPGQLVVDPMAGIGTTLVEAALLGRHAVGIELEQRWVDLGRQNLDFTLAPEHRRLA